jgi:ribosome-binding protein aMBF1 (putative translation factor)
MIKEEQKSFYDAVGKLLTSARRHRTMSIAQLSKLSGEQIKTIQSIESGKGCSLHHLVWMKDILNIDLRDITYTEGISGEEESSGADSFI